ncbi:hypothetical protein Droror1_Dr00001331 [Drosera rotundifolia]
MKMKIQCDVCSKNEATLFCTADEAALCGDCDQKVHHANKLASKHQRFPLIIPDSSSSIPMCDICQEKKALLFCQQDRAIICRDCDVAIHTANELTMKHNRFLLTGTKLSSIAASAATATTDTLKVASDSGGYHLVPDFKSQNSNNKQRVSVEPQVSASSLNSKGIDANSNIENDVSSLLIYDSGVGGGGCASSISEYLMEMLPGWQVDDFLDPGSAPFGLSKGCDDDMISFGDTDLGKNNEVVSSHEMMGIWVPQAPTMAMESPYTNSITFGLSGFGGEKKMETSRKATNSRKRVDDGFTVPQMSSQAIGSKGSKTFW